MATDCCVDSLHGTHGSALSALGLGRKWRLFARRIIRVVLFAKGICWDCRSESLAKVENTNGSAI